MRRMKHLKRLGPGTLAILFTVFAADRATAGSVEPPAVPASFEIQVDPASVTPGSQTRVSVRLSPADGVKINRYPRIRLAVEAQDGLVGAAEGSVGNDKAPPPGQMESNYFKHVDPVELTLTIDPAATRGTHEIPAKLTYFYCVAASGFCAPKTVPVEIALAVE
jgi:hypothetical protein